MSHKKQIIHIFGVEVGSNEPHVFHRLASVGQRHYTENSEAHQLNCWWAFFISCRFLLLQTVNEAVRMTEHDKLYQKIREVIGNRLFTPTARLPYSLELICRGI